MSLTEDRHDRVMRAQSSAGMIRGWRHRMQDDPRVSHSGARWHRAALLFVVAADSKFKQRFQYHR